MTVPLEGLFQYPLIGSNLCNSRVPADRSPAFELSVPSHRVEPLQQMVEEQE